MNLSFGVGEQETLVTTSRAEMPEMLCRVGPVQRCGLSIPPGKAPEAVIPSQG